MITLTQFEVWAINRGFEKDKYGNFKKLVTRTKEGKEETNLMRYKVQAHSIRREIQVEHEASPYSPKSNSWVLLSSGYFKDLTITPEGKLAGLKR